MMKGPPLTLLTFLLCISAASGEFKKNVFVIDTVKYISMGYVVSQISYNVNPVMDSRFSDPACFIPLKIRGTNTIDLYSRDGNQFASVTLPDSNFQSIAFTQTFVDADLDWEYIVSGKISGTTTFRVFDSDASLLLQDTGKVSLGFDGSNTFLYIVLYQPSSTLVSYLLRSNLSISSFIPGLSKKSSSPVPTMFFNLSNSSDEIPQTLSSGIASIPVFHVRKD